MGQGSFFGYSFKQGEFERPEVGFRKRAEPEAGRYHLYVSLACPWSHRAVLVRHLRGLDSVIGLSVTNPIWNDRGWTFGDAPGAIPDTVNGVKDVIDLYRKVDPKFSDPETVPILWDKKAATIVNNESRDLMQMFDVDFERFAQSPLHPSLYPVELREEIDAAITAMYTPINNGVYRSGFAQSQKAYERAVTQVFQGLDEWEKRLADRRFICGDRFTLADISLFVTLVRFDLVYYSHFKCNVRRITDYPNLWGWLRDVYQLPGVAETCDFAHMKQHYYGSHAEINPTGIIPVGPDLDFAREHGRHRLGV